MKRVLMVTAVMAVAEIAWLTMLPPGAVQAAQKPEATKGGISIHLKTSIEYGVDVYRWFHDRFADKPRPWGGGGSRGEPQNKKAPVNPGELSE